MGLLLQSVPQATDAHASAAQRIIINEHNVAGFQGGAEALIGPDRTCRLVALRFQTFDGGKRHASAPGKVALTPGEKGAGGSDLVSGYHVLAILIAE